MKEVVMLIDDDVAVREKIATFLEYRGYEVLQARNLFEAFSVLEKTPADLVVIRTVSSEFEEAEMVKKIKQKGPLVMMMLSKSPNNEILEKAAQAGIDDFLVGPIDLRFLEIRIERALEVKYFFDCKRIFFEGLMEKISANERTINELLGEISRLSFEAMEILSHISELKDYETHEHTARVGIISARIAESMDLDPVFVTQIRFAAPLHDIGKVLIPNQILTKPGKLTEEEWELVKKHPEIGWEILSKSSSDVLKLAASIALTHHERWNGSGYPRGLVGKEIPIEGRIVAVADSFDAMVSKRPYKGMKSLQEAFLEIRRFSGELYDPEVVKAFSMVSENILKLYEEAKENDERGNRKNCFRDKENV